MTRIAAALLLLALAACAQPLPTDPRAPEAAQVYQDLKLQVVEHQMLGYDKEMTYGFAAVNCGLRNQQWMDMLQAVYASGFNEQLLMHPLTPDQQSQAKAYAEAHIANPSPPPIICEMISADSALPQLDDAVALEALKLAATEKKSG